MGCGGRNRARQQLRFASLFLLIVFLVTIEADLPYTSVASEAEEAEVLREEQNWADEGLRRTGKRNDNNNNNNTNSNDTGLSSPIDTAQQQPGNTPLGDNNRGAKGRKMFSEIGDETYSRPDSIVRHRKLYSRCSSKHLRIYGSRVDGLALPDDIYSELRFETRGADSLVTIQGSSSRNFLCFNKKGRIAVKHSVRSRRCLFHEIYSSDHYTEFHSAANASWWLGFGRMGQRLHGQRWTRSRRLRRCFQFLKIDPSDGSGRANAEAAAEEEEEGHHWSKLGRVRPHHRRSYHGGVPRLRHSLET